MYEREGKNERKKERKEKKKERKKERTGDMKMMFTLKSNSGERKDE